jgi:plasmid replication initiation protein
MQEKRLVMWLAEKNMKEDQDFKEHDLLIKDFSEMVGLSPKTQERELKKITKSLIGRVIEVQDSDGSLKQFSWLAFAHWKPKKGKCLLSFHPALKPYLLQLENCFTQSELGVFLKLKRVSSMRIFELLLQYEEIGERRISLIDLRFMLGLNPGEYRLYGHLKERILEPAMREINEKTEYEATFKEHSSSRKVEFINFTIKKRTYFEKHQRERVAILEKEMESEKELILQIMELGYSRVIAKKFFKENSEDVIRNALKSVNIQVERGNVKNPKAMFKIAIQEHWKPDVFLSKKQRNKALVSMRPNPPT